jgi:hypothetical protein
MEKISQLRKDKKKISDSLFYTARAKQLWSLHINLLEIFAIWVALKTLPFSGVSLVVNSDS